MPSGGPLPIDAVLAQVTDVLARAGNAVLVAPPGAGKTTRVPPAVVDAGLAGDGQVVVLEPRRLAARMAARRVAAERGQEVGDEVGYEVRFDRRAGPRTRLRFVTEGVFTRQLVADPGLARVGAVIIDELHERHLSGDLALALVRRLQRTTRPDLRLVAMSATLDPGPVAGFLGDCPVIVSAGRQHPVDIDYARAGDDRALELRVAGAVRRALRDDRELDHDQPGHVLVFLPGASEIRRALDATRAALGDGAEVDLLPLHGDLPAAEQDRAVGPSRRRKIIFATNVAESSITIDGVRWVIDSGLARVARHSPWSGIPSLRTEPVSQASATQRAGRAGRTGPGRCLRLYTRHDHDGRPGYDAPEVARVDLAEAALSLHALGVGRLAGADAPDDVGDSDGGETGAPGEPGAADADAFIWFEPPPAAAVEAAEALLERLGAIDARGRVSALGRALLRLPVHPRQARVVIAAAARGLTREGCALAALLGERPIRLDRRADFGRSGRGAAAAISADSDLLEDLEAFEAARRDRMAPERLRAAGLDPGAVRAVDRVRRQLERLAAGLPDLTEGDAGRVTGARARGAEAMTADEIDAALRLAILAGYPDRVGRRRRAGAAEVVLAGGGSGALAATSVVLDAPFLVAVDARERGRGQSAVIHRASAIELDWLLDLYIERVEDSDELVWNPSPERVERVTRLRYEGLILDEQRDPVGARRDPVGAAAVLAEAARAAGIERFLDRDALAEWRARVGFCAGVVGAGAGKEGDGGEMVVPDDEDLSAALDEVCVGLTSFAELRRAGLLEAVKARLSAPERARVERLAPTHVAIPGRRRVAVHYEPDRPPWIASRMQDFFGAREGPRVGEGRVPLTLHLLAPNQRAVQVTTDLAGFWQRHYPGLRRQLMRRYPKHAWPEDPANAAPPRR
ncbi:ATP-dependent RNA helicase [Haliangium sp.]|uniref:ATP-dependent RNA helicase n=1 Tax=Haliangium sp. TaxID=2663208 RepID=UPI003D0BBC9E